jgi:hypothetical protein
VQNDQQPLQTSPTDHRVKASICSYYAGREFGVSLSTSIMGDLEAWVKDTANICSQHLAHPLRGLLISLWVLGALGTQRCFRVDIHIHLAVRAKALIFCGVSIGFTPSSYKQLSVHQFHMVYQRKRDSSFMDESATWQAHCSIT